MYLLYPPPYPHPLTHKYTYTYTSTYPQVDKPAWKSSGGVHLDMDPWGYLGPENKTEEVLASLQYDGKNVNHFIFENNQVHFSTQKLHVQAVLNLEDNLAE